MFERFGRVAQASRSSRWRAPIIASGAVLHAALFTGMWISGLWDVRRVSADSNELTISVVPSPPPMEAAPKGSAKPAPPKGKTVVRGPVQPAAKPEPPPAQVPTNGPAEEGPPTPGAGTGEGVPGGPSDGVPTTEPPPPDPPPAQEPPKPPQQHRVAEKVLEQQRVSGDKLIRPDDGTAQRMAREGVNEVRATLRLCLDERGTPSSISVLRSSGYSSYDDKLEREMSSWRYRPFMVDGVASPVCTSVIFIYRQR